MPKTSKSLSTDKIRGIGRKKTECTPGRIPSARLMLLLLPVLTVTRTLLVHTIWQGWESTRKHTLLHRRHWKKELKSKTV